LSILYLRRGEQQAAADAFGTPEGHAVRLDEQGEVIGITIVNAEWLLGQRGDQYHRAQLDRARRRRARRRPRRRLTGDRIERADWSQNKLT
jgi:uncharacterized protein YuzE